MYLISLVFLKLLDYSKVYSDDNSTWLSAAIVDESNIDLNNMIIGSNTLTCGSIKTPEKLERPLKNFFIEHAERNAIYSAAKKGFKTDGMTMVCPWFSCADCARGIVQSGIKKVIGLGKFEDPSFHPNWKESIERGRQILREGGVAMEFYNGVIGSSMRINNEVHAV